MFSAPSGMELAVIFIVILLLFGKKIPELAKGLGSGIKNFKNALKEGVEEEEIAKAENIQNPINNEIKILNEKIN
ncbi:twin arginine translocation system, TatA/E family protein [Arcobacter acticola]|jgi:sec-independent protein translocase protein TatA|uniref:Sec-independent protein translocase protein TatA n=1 Tax=Arcobacter acticola TaxID=1849015 RepID=A0A6M8EXT1_9BACT|nr:twin-arginine translocase TatA/TatE family subunit [Arcobacter acticola]QKE29355.1 twin arginine translocation system, TatA/E family protein [Arcobacter acticola]